MKKVPTNIDILKLLLTGLGSLSFGIIFFFIPILSDLLLIIGGFLVFISLATFGTKVFNKVLK